MTTPFKALNPFTPRYVEIDYVAADGGCCAMSSSSGSQQVFPPDPPIPLKYFFKASEIDASNNWIMWVRDEVTGNRIIVEEFFVSDPGLFDITPFFSNPEITSLSGVQRNIFFTRVVSFTSGTFEIGYYTSFINETGNFSLDLWLGVPIWPDFDGWSTSDEVQTVIIENYQTSGGTFEVIESPPPS
jgi:hypothetical protein